MEYLSHRPLVSLSRAAHKIEYCGLSAPGGTGEDHRQNPLWLLEGDNIPVDMFNLVQIRNRIVHFSGSHHRVQDDPMVAIHRLMR